MAGRKTLQAIIDRSERKLGIKGKLVLDYHAGGWRVDDDKAHHISPRLSFGEMEDWLDGFEGAVDFLSGQPKKVEEESAVNQALFRRFLEECVKRSDVFLRQARERFIRMRPVEVADLLEQEIDMLGTTFGTVDKLLFVALKKHGEEAFISDVLKQ